MSFRPRLSAVVASAIFTCSVPIAAALAQQSDGARLARLDDATRAVVIALVDSARAARLPTDPLVGRALEGAKKGAAGDHIISAVRGLSAELRSAQSALGAGASPAEITAGASALNAGLQPRDLARVRAAATHAKRKHVTMPLTVATDLVARAVSPVTAADVVLSLTRAGLRDDELTAFQRNVRADIDRGADPGAAAQTRARGAILRAGHTS